MQLKETDFSIQKKMPLYVLRSLSDSELQNMSHCISQSSDLKAYEKLLRSGLDLLPNSKVDRDLGVKYLSLSISFIFLGFYKVLQHKELLWKLFLLVACLGFVMALVS